MKLLGGSLVFLLFTLASRWDFADAYLPVIVVHGIFSDAENMNGLVGFIKNAHPGTEVYNIDGYDNEESIDEMWKQVTYFKEKMMPIFKNATDGVNMICFSQGGLTCRAILETTPEHNVKTFVSLSSPQGGQYGDTIYLNSPVFLPNFTKEHMYMFFYSELGQELSIGNYWKDPHHLTEYYDKSRFLPKLDKPSDSSYRDNFVKIEKLVMIGGPNDGVITPWQSSHFASYDDEDNVLELENQEFYLNDAFGMKTLNTANKLHIHTVSGVEHTYWHKNKTVFNDCIEPYLN